MPNGRRGFAPNPSTVSIACYCLGSKPASQARDVCNGFSEKFNRWSLNVERCLAAAIKTAMSITVPSCDAGSLIGRCEHRAFEKLGYLSAGKSNPAYACDRRRTPETNDNYELSPRCLVTVAVT